MPSSFKRDADFAAKAAVQFVYPTLKDLLGGANIYSMHGSDATAKLFATSNIDALAVTADGTHYPIAIRVQRGANYASFSIRTSRASGSATELAKLRKAFETNALMPTYSVQAFVDSESTATVGVARTIDLLKSIEQFRPQVLSTRDGQARFYAIKWCDLQAQGFDVAIFTVNAADNSLKITRTA